MEGAGFSGDALDEESGVFINEDGHNFSVAVRWRSGKKNSFCEFLNFLLKIQSQLRCKDFTAIEADEIILSEVETRLADGLASWG